MGEMLTVVVRMIAQEQEEYQEQEVIGVAVAVLMVQVLVMGEKALLLLVILVVVVVVAMAAQAATAIKAPSGGSIYSTETGGSGGGGGYSTSGGGGGGGGYLKISSNGNISNTGTINANGGNGGAWASYAYGGGGGGSGGRINLIAQNISNSGSINAKGGNGYVVSTAGGGGGGGGRIVLQDSDGVVGGTLSVVYGTSCTSTSGCTNAVIGVTSASTLTYVSSGTFTSAAIDLGSSSVFGALTFTSTIPAQTQTSCTVSTGAGCAVKIQVAANTDNATWNYVGPDGTTATYFTQQAGEMIPSSLNNNRYLRYRAYLATVNTAYTPVLDDVTVNYLIPGALNFSATITPQNEAVMKGGSLNVSPGITATLTYGASAPNPVTFSVDSADLPAGVSVNFTNSPCSPTLTTATPDCTSSFTINTSGTTPPGAFAIPIKASIIVDTASTITKEATYAFTITEMFDFSMAWTGASSGAVTQGGNVTSAFSVTQIAGDESESVLFSYFTSGSGISTAFSLSSCFPNLLA